MTLEMTAEELGHAAHGLGWARNPATVPAVNQVLRGPDVEPRTVQKTYRGYVTGWDRAEREEKAEWATRMVAPY